ncbi:PhoH family protein, partial [Burkholderia cenocepacia]|nr:PhoH family protein [Burkholderia cenocepacia]
MPLPTPPSKLGSLLPPDEYKAKARPAKAAKKSAEGDASTAGDYGPASVAQPMIEAANTAAPLRAVASSARDAASAPARGRKTKQTAALLQPLPAPAEPAAPVVARHDKPAAGKPATAPARDAGAATKS